MAATFVLFVARQITLAYRQHAVWATGGEQMGSPEEKDKPSTTLPGTVEKIIKPVDPSEPEKAQVAIKEGAPVDVTIEAEKKDTTKKAE